MSAVNVTEPIHDFFVEGEDLVLSTRRHTGYVTSIILNLESAGILLQKLPGYIAEMKDNVRKRNIYHLDVLRLQKEKIEKEIEEIKKEYVDE